MSTWTKTKLARRGPTALVVTLVVVALLAAVLVADGSAGGRHLFGVSGTYVLVDVAGSDCTPLDDARLGCVVTAARSEYTSGQLAGGFSVANFRSVIDCATQRTYASGVETFTGSIGGRSGTLTWRFVLAADVDCETFVPSNIDLVGVVTRGTGGLSQVSGALWFGDTTYRGLLLEH